jgi:hypothetical protein
MNKKNLVLLGCVLVWGSVMSTPSRAALLGLDPLSSNPDLFSSSLSVTVAYTPSNGLFTATGQTAAYTPADTNLNNGDPYLVANSNDSFNPGTFSLTAHIATNGTFLSGTVTITGGVYDDSLTQIEPDGSLLFQGNLAAFGFLGSASPNVDEFDFLVNVTGGALGGAYGSLAGVLLHPGDTTFNNNFNVNFSNDGFGTADTRMVPEPTTELLVMVSVFGLCWFVRRAPLRKP